jgi:hypothetical protein
MVNGVERARAIARAVMGRGDLMIKHSMLDLLESRWTREEHSHEERRITDLERFSRTLLTEHGTQVERRPASTAEHLARA